MRLQHQLSAAAATLALAGLAPAQVALNELHISQTGVDDEEFIELIGAPGTSLDGYMVLVVDSDDTPVLGILDRVYDLTGGVINANGLFVLGDSGSVLMPDFVTGATNSFENSSATFYLVVAPDPGVRANYVSVLINTDVRTMPGATTTVISTDPGVTILDAVAILDDDPTDQPFDGAPGIGPDGTFLPAGIFRTGDCPNDWCTDEFLNFFWDPGDPNYVATPTDPTPGAPNIVSGTCMTVPTIGNCGGVSNIGTPYCATVNNSTGGPGVMTASGSASVGANDVTLAGSSLPVGAFAFFLTSLDQGFVANPGGSQGNLCLGGSIGRYVGSGQIQQASASGDVSLVIDLTQIPQPTGFTSVAAGETWNFQCWHRDVIGGQATSNFTNGLEILFN